MRLLAFVLLISSAGAATFHVAPDGDDKAGGSPQAPWRTIERALSSLHAGDTLVARAGEYKGLVLIPRGGEWRRPVTVRGEPGAVIAGRLRVTARGPVVVEGLRVAGPVEVSGTTPGVVLRKLEANEIRLENTLGVLIDRCRVAGAGVGISVEGRNTVIRNCLLEGHAAAGIALGGEGPAIDVTIRNNTFVNNGAQAGAPGAVWFCWAKDVRFENNIIQAAAGRRLFTRDGGRVLFSHNLYFSPNDRAGAAFGWEGRVRTGFAALRQLTADPAAEFADPLWDGREVHRFSPALESGIGRTAPGELDFAGRPRVAGRAVDAGAHEHPEPPGPRVSGNQIVVQNRILRLRGVGVGDPLLDRRDRPLSDYRVIRQTWNANVVRMSIHPYVWREAEEFGGRAAVIDWIRHDMDAARAAGLFVILDWHVTGWPDLYVKPSEPGEPDGLHDASFALAEDFWNEAARAFGRDPGVIFELWNEPVRGPDDWKPDPKAWSQLRPYMERLTGIVREHSDNLIIVTGGSWAYALAGIRENPPSDFNTAVAWHVYAGKENNDELRWAAAFDDIDRDFPVIVTEWGFDENGKPHFRGGVGDFGEKFVRNWLEGRRLHWLSWCWHPDVGPSLLTGDWQSPTLFGRLTGQLLRANARPVFEPPAAFDRLGGPRRIYSPFWIN